MDTIDGMHRVSTRPLKRVSNHLALICFVRSPLYLIAIQIVKHNPSSSVLVSELSLNDSRRHSGGCEDDTNRGWMPFGFRFYCFVYNGRTDTCVADAASTSAGSCMRAVWQAIPIWRLTSGGKHAIIVCGRMSCEMMECESFSSTSGSGAKQMSRVVSLTTLRC